MRGRGNPTCLCVYCGEDNQTMFCYTPGKVGRPPSACVACTEKRKHREPLQKMATPRRQDKRGTAEGSKVWVNSVEATEILSKNSGREINKDYARKLASMGKIKTRHINANTLLYHRRDVESYVVQKR